MFDDIEYYKKGKTFIIYKKNILQQRRKKAINLLQNCNLKLQIILLYSIQDKQNFVLNEDNTHLSFLNEKLKKLYPENKIGDYDKQYNKYKIGIKNNLIKKFNSLFDSFEQKQINDQLNSKQIKLYEKLSMINTEEICVFDLLKYTKELILIQNKQKIKLKQL